ncbi:hypothetical protein [Enterobacter phage 01_vB_Eclo_IJM]|nr:hypothetical protein [Enterobacter phage 01_vB_Eclo_IJM]
MSEKKIALVLDGDFLVFSSWLRLKMRLTGVTTSGR